jgi:hypothetical protein
MLMCSDLNINFERFSRFIFLEKINPQSVMEIHQGKGRVYPCRIFGYHAHHFT